AIVGAGTAVFFRRRFGTFVLLLGLVMAVGVRLAPQGRLWNARLLPFWYLSLYILAALVVVEVIVAASVLLARAREEGAEPAPRRGVLLAGPIVVALLVAVIVGLPLRSLPLGHTSNAGATYTF